MKRLEKSRSTDRKVDHDDSFPVALDENLQRISAMEAILWKRRNPNVLFYCPKCVQIDPDHRTIVHPSSHQTPRFNRRKNEDHLSVCQYRNATKYLGYLAEQFQIEFHQKTLNPVLPPFQAGAFVDQALQTRRSLYETEEQKKFIQLIEQLLQDYEIELFYQRYGHLSLVNGEDQCKFRDFVRTLEIDKLNFAPEEGKLNLVVGSVYEVEWSERRLYAILDHTQVEYDFSIYFHPYHYQKSTVDLLKERRIACLGYVQKVDENAYQMEILSMDYQVAFLDGPRPCSALTPTLKADVFLNHLLSHASEYTPLEKKLFKRSYYGDQFQRFLRQNIERERKIKERLEQTMDEIPKLNEKILELKVSKKQLEKNLENHQQHNHTFLQKLRNVLLLRNAQVKSKEQDMEQNLQKVTEQIAQTLIKLRQLKKERSQLKQELSQIEEKRQDLMQRQKEEKKIKKRVQGYLYECKLAESRKLVIDLCPKADRFNAEVEVTLFGVEIKEGYYFPHSKIQQIFATDGFSGEREIQMLIQKVWRFIEKRIQQDRQKASQEESLS